MQASFLVEEDMLTMYVAVEANASRVQNMSEEQV